MRTVILFIFYVIMILMAIPVLLLCFLFRIRKPLFWIGKGGIWMATKILGIKMEVSGREHVEARKPYVFMSNHISFLDGPLLFWLIPQQVRVIMKKENLRIPVIGLAMRHIDFVPVDRKGLKAGKRSIDRAIHLIKNKKYSFLIFPEGTRSRDGKLQAFRRGGYFLAIHSQVPIIPISISGSFGLMPRGSFFVRRGTVKIRFHPQIESKGLTLEDIPALMEKTRAGIIMDLADKGPATRTSSDSME